MDNAKDKLVTIIVEQTGWGPVSGWQGGDFRRLSAVIFDKTRVTLSESTLRRILGKADYPHLPSETTLNTLAIFAGYESWRAFTAQITVEPRKHVISLRAALFAGAILLFTELQPTFTRTFHEASPTHSVVGF